MKAFLCLLVLFVALLPTPTFAATYYVSKNPATSGSSCGNGSDSNNGTATSTPFLTIQKALDTITTGTGNTIYLCKGSYGGATISKSGASAGSPIRLTQLSSEVATLDAYVGVGANVTHNWASGDTNDYSFFNIPGSRSFIQIDHLLVTNTNPILPTIAALNLDNTTDQTTYRSYINTPGIFGNFMIFGTTAADIVLDSLTVTNMTGPGGGGAMTRLTMTNSTFTDYVNYGYFSYITGANNGWVIDGNTFDGYTYVWHVNTCGGTGAISSTSSIWRNNTFKNTASKPYWQPLDGQWIHGANSIYICPLGPSNQIYNNTFFKTNWGLSQIPDSGGQSIRVSSNAQGTSGNLIASNTYQYNYCDVHLPNVGGGNSFIDNLTGTVTNTRNVTNCDVDATYWTQTTNLRGVSTASFNNAAAGDLTLAPGASAIGTGTNLSAYFTTDKLGVTRTVPWTVGAYAFTSDPGSIDWIQTVKDDTDTGSIINVTSGTTTTGHTLVVTAFWVNNVIVNSVGISTGSATFSDCGTGRLAWPAGTYPGYSQCFIATGITGGTSPVITMTLSGSSSYSEIIASEYTASSPDVGINGAGTATSGITVSTGNMTPSVTDGMLVAYMVDDNAGVTTIPGFTNRSAPYPWYFDKSFATSQGTLTIPATSTQSLTQASILAVALKPGVPVNSTTTGACSLLSTFKNISSKFGYSNDDNGNNSVVLEYKAASSSTWLPAFTPFIDRRVTIGGVTNPYSYQARGSIVGLTADTSYNVRITFSDPDGVSGTNPVSCTISTLDPTPPSGSGTTYNATSSTTLNSALAAIVPGDVINLSAATTYNAFTISRSGDAAHWITVKCTNASAVINGTSVTQNIAVSANYIIIQDCIVPSSDQSGIVIGSGQNHVLVQNMTFQNIAAICTPTTPYDAGGVTIGAGSSDIYAVNNTILSPALNTPGCTSSPSYDSPGTGIQWYDGVTTIVVTGNTIGPGFRDAISTDNGNYTSENTDIGENVMTGYKDDGPESKGSSVNARIWGNTMNITTAGYGNSCVATNVNSTTIQYGPIYVYRNYCKVTTAGAGGLTTFKISASGSQPQYFFHNSVDTHLAGANWDCFLIGVSAATGATMQSKNNICFSQNSVFLYQGATGVVSDYNDFFNGGNDWAFNWNDGSNHTYNTKALFCSGQVQDCHSVFANPGFDSSLHITAASPAFGVGVAIPNFNGTNSLWPGTPNIGAYQAACTPHHLTYTAQPSSATLGASLGTVSVGVYNSTNALCTDATDSITLSKNGSATWGTLTSASSLTKSAVSGIATWTDLAVTVTAGAGSINAAASGLTGSVSNSITITATCTPDHLTFTSQPTSATLGSSLGTVSVGIYNASNVLCGGATNSITLSKTGGATWGTLTSTTSLTKSATSGVATWTDLSVTVTPGSGTITAAASGLTGTASNSITITASCTPHHLTYISQPSSAALNASLGTVSVGVYDAGNVLCSTATNSITLSKNGSAMWGTLVSGSSLTKSAVTGVATWTDLSVSTTTGAGAIDAAASGLTSATSNSITISTTCTPDHITFIAQPSSAVIGATLGTVTVGVYDSGSVLCSGATTSITLSKAMGATWGTLVSGSSLTKAAVAGIATWTDLSVTTTPGAGSINAAASMLTGDTSSSITISSPPCVPHHLTFISQPTSATLGSSLGTVSVGVYDSGSALCSAATSSVTLSKNGGATWGALASSSLTKSAVSGVATWTDLSVTTTAGSGSINAASSGLTGATSNSITISSSCTPDHLTFISQPSSAPIGGTLGTVTVGVYNASNALCSAATNSVTLSKNMSATWGTLASGSSLTKAAVAGVATWTDLSVTTTAGAGSIDAASSMLTGATSSSITITATCTPHHLTYISQPSSATLGSTLGSVSVGVYDSGSVLCTSATNAVTLSKNGSATWGTLVSATSLTKSAVSGVATWTDLAVTSAVGAGSIDAAASGLTGTTSNSITISAGAPVPGNSGTITTSSIATTTLTLNWTKATDSQDPQSSLQYKVCQSTSNNVTSVAQCEAATIIRTFIADINTFAVTSLSPVTSYYWNVVVMDTDSNKVAYVPVNATTTCGPTKLVFTDQPSNAVVGATLGTVSVSVENSANTVCTDSTAPITLSKNSGATWGTLITGSSLTKSAVAGIATWTDLSITTTAGAGSIDAASFGLTGATSNSVTISGGTSVTAASCSKADIDAAVKAVTSGGTVNVLGAGSCTYTSAVTVPNTKGVTINGGGATISSNLQRVFTINANATDSSRITGFTFIRTGNLGNAGQETIGVVGSPATAPFRVDHNTFYEPSDVAAFISATGNPRGVIDNNVFTGGAASLMIQLYGPSTAASGWTASLTPGGADMPYIEDNTFTYSGNGGCCAYYYYGTSAVQSYQGARFAFRYNILNMAQVSAQGTIGGVGTRWWEIYNNTFNTNYPTASQAYYMDLKAGSGVIWGNTKTGPNLASNGGVIRLTEEDSGPWPLAYQVGSGINGQTNRHSTCGGGTLNQSPAYVWDNGEMNLLLVAPSVILNRDVFSSVDQPETLLRQQLTTDNCSTTYSYVPLIYPYPGN